MTRRTTRSTGLGGASPGLRRRRLDGKPSSSPASTRAASSVRAMPARAMSVVLLRRACPRSACQAEGSTSRWREATPALGPSVSRRARVSARRALASTARRSFSAVRICSAAARRRSAISSVDLSRTGCEAMTTALSSRGRRPPRVAVFNELGGNRRAARAHQARPQPARRRGAAPALPSTRAAAARSKVNRVADRHRAELSSAPWSLTREQVIPTRSRTPAVL